MEEPKKARISNGHMWLESGQMKVADLQREAREHRLARGNHAADT
jgi:hypothetical protein